MANPGPKLPPELQAARDAFFRAATPEAMAADDARQAAARRVERWRKDPVLFAQEVFGLQTWDRWEEMVRLIAFEKSVAIKSGHKTGKSLGFGVAAWHEGICYPGARVVMTSSSDLQVNDILWREFANLWKMAVLSQRPDGSECRLCLKCFYPLAPRHKETGVTPPCSRCGAIGDGVLKPKFGDLFGGEPPSLARTGVVLPNGSDIKGFTTNEPERMAGTSAARLLYLVDEASGIDDAIFAAVSGNRMGGARLAMASNPTRQIGFFFDAFHRKSKFWKVFTVSSLETPNVKAGRIVIPGLAEPATIEEFKDEHDEESPYFKVRILGEFAGGSDDVVVPIDLISASTARYRLLQAGGKSEKDLLDSADGPLCIGIDPARYGGDEFSFAPARGLIASSIRAIQRANQELDDVEMAGHAGDMARELRRNQYEKVTFRIDVTGGYGNGVADLIRRMDLGEVIEVNSSDAPNDPRFVNRRAELHWAQRTWFKAGGMMAPGDQKLERELAAPKYTHDLKGKIAVTKKDDLRKILKRSPDRFDARALAVWDSEASADVPPSYGDLPRNVRLPMSVGVHGF